MDWASTPSWDPQTEKLEDVGEADVVFDVIGEDVLDRSATLVRTGGTLVTTTLLPRVRHKDGVKGKTFTLGGRRLPAQRTCDAAPARPGVRLRLCLEGSVRSQLVGKPMTTYPQGENWVEQPGAHHVLTENTSRTKRAMLLIVFVSNTGDKLKVDDPRS